MLLQTLNVLFFRGLPGSQELNQQLANLFTKKVECFMHMPHLVLCHTGYLRHAFTACTYESTQLIMAARPITAPPSARASSCFILLHEEFHDSNAESALVSAGKKAGGPLRPHLLRGGVACLTWLH